MVYRTFGTAVYAMGVFFDVERQFGVSQTLALAGLSLYALGLGSSYCEGD